MPQVLNKCDVYKLESHHVFVGRPTKWGNPFEPGPKLTREEAVRRYEQHLLATPELLAALDELRGKDLVCFDAPKASHADVLLKYANMEDL